MNRLFAAIVLFAALCFLAPLPALATVVIDTVPVGNPGNAADTVTPNPGYGAVAYDYCIGKYEVTLEQYTEFLNAVAKTDTYSLYNTSLATNLNIAGIARANSPGSYTYSVIGSGNHPVQYISWFDAARFTNWLHNGQPSGAQGPGTTEDGAYSLLGAMSGTAFAKNPLAQYWIPSEDEWYKAAYYDPVSAGADAGGTPDYWLYPTRSDSDPGNVVGGSANQANYKTSVYSVMQSGTYSSSQNYLTDVGAFSGSASYYGTFDQGGNAYEWNDAVIGSTRGLRGSSWTIGVADLRSTSRPNFGPGIDNSDVGFRVATVPEPSTLSLAALGLAAGLLARRRKRSAR